MNIQSLRMPKNPDYSKTIIYKLVCCDVNVTDCYVGHTTNFVKRKYSHKSRCNNRKAKGHNCYVYKFIRDHGGFENWTMIELEKWSCSNKFEAAKRERYHIEELKASLNKVVPSRSFQEYRSNNKIDIYLQQKAYHHRNKEKINEWQKLNLNVHVADVLLMQVKRNI